MSIAELNNSAELNAVRRDQKRLNEIAIELAMRAFLRIEYHCFVKGISWFEAKTSIIRNAVRTYLAKPIYTLAPVNLYATA